MFEQALYLLTISFPGSDSETQSNYKTFHRDVANFFSFISLSYFSLASNSSFLLLSSNYAQLVASLCYHIHHCCLILHFHFSALPSSMRLCSQILKNKIKLHELRQPFHQEFGLNLFQTSRKEFLDIIFSIIRQVFSTKTQCAQHMKQS